MQKHSLHSADSRRDFIKTSAMLSIALSVGSLPLFGVDSKTSKIPMPKRILGKGSYAFEVSALAFGCMGLKLPPL
ncbi:twin-arginine translocation signal domain-containing protein [Helicobacter muridarum]|uniref:Twin-arginine translocation signal domain-containing protein n=1 Tax=Helicobacter muridarum TaxID=216 RepID=A0A377PVH9_9HELI|nr:twin-arginine translocation signal domain-containing protein [Helicobacter muridarum]TLD99154.1 twin-arginine translocation signal domain-containing protein [Helicobacter muridarum]STQ86886.1 Uncharacterised protein [Helicobacter muridarum]